MTDDLTAKILDELVALRRSSGGMETKQESDLRRRFFYQFDRRLRTLEDAVESLESRILRLETATTN